MLLKLYLSMFKYLIVYKFITVFKLQFNLSLTNFFLLINYLLVKLNNKVFSNFFENAQIVKFLSNNIVLLNK